ncbi:putative F-box protein At1g47765 [Miscanthus floridulus]|uniref:putative F-box protein At1g47765 n=1 Tax=Miscanthus floridulus TaxID=154761 RepID=UPI00345AB81F
MAAKLRKRDGNGRDSDRCRVRSLPEDIVLEVLVRLPAKALCRFRCVSKAWRTLISDPTFVAVQRSRARPHLVGVFFQECWPPEVRVMDMDGNVDRVFQVDMDDGNAFGMLQQAATQLNNVMVHASAVPMIINPDAGRACTVHIGRAAPSGAKLTFGHVALSGAFKVMYVEESLPSQICKVTTIVDGGVELLRWRQRSAPPFVTSWWPERRITVNGVVCCLPPPLSEYIWCSFFGHAPHSGL